MVPECGLNENQAYSIILGENLLTLQIAGPGERRGPRKEEYSKHINMYRTHTCGELRIENVGQKVTLAGWVQRSRKLGGMTFIDLRDRYGITQLVLEADADAALVETATSLGREYVIQATGEVVERQSRNARMDTGDIEIKLEAINILNKSVTPPFTIEDESDGGEDLHNFMEIETPYLIKSTPEGARDFVVPSRMNPGQFYALPQSPQTFKQLLMVAGYDRYFQIVRCFRDEDLRADRQPEFTQIDCEMSFVEQEDVLNMFEGMMRTMFKNVLGVDKVKGKGFSVLEDAAYVGAIAVPGGAEYTRKQIDELTEWVKRPQVGAKGLIYIKLNADGSVKSSIDKFYSPNELKVIAEAVEAKTGDIVFVMSGDSNRKVQTMLGVLRIEMGNRLGLRDPKVFAPLWIVDFPLLEWSEEDGRFYAMHHPFTAPKPEHMNLFYSDKKEDLERVCANAYDFVLNGTELGGGSIRIHDAEVQKRMFEVLGIGPEEAEYKFGFIIHAFQYGAPPHGGLAFGFDRVCTLFAGKESIRDFIAFPKNNQGRDVMIDAPSKIDQTQLDELSLDLRPQQEK